MDSDISLHAGEVFDYGELARAVDDGNGAPLLAFRLPELEKRAWRKGRKRARALERAALRAFGDVAARTLRHEDWLGHRPGSDVFLAVLKAPGRTRSAATAQDCRLALARIGAAINAAVGLSFEMGWTLVRKLDCDDDVEACITQALQHGELERRRYDFFSIVGHELRTPLTSVCGYLETLGDPALDPSLRSRFTRSAQKEAHRLTRLVNGMFELSLLDVSESWRAAGSSLRAGLDGAAGAVARPAEARGVALQIRSEGDAQIGLDRDACVHVFANVIGNAVKHGRDGGKVRVAVEQSEHGVTVHVDDDGPGIPSPEAGLVFERGIRGSNATASGAGLGLSIARTLVERAGGNIRAGTSPLGGARFSVELPRAERTLH